MPVVENSGILDEFGTVLRYTESFPDHCPLNSHYLTRLREYCTVTLSSSSDVAYPGDVAIDSRQSISFGINRATNPATIRVKIGDHVRIVSRISHLPGNDRVLHYADQVDLGPFEEKLYEKFTRFIRSKRVLFEGSFSCLNKLTGATSRTDSDCVILADRPVPLHVPSMISSWKLQERGRLDYSRDDGRRLYHIDTQNWSDNRSTIRDKFIYVGDEDDLTMSTLRRYLDWITPTEVFKHAFMIKCLCAEWLKLLKAVSSASDLSAYTTRVERILRIWEQHLCKMEEEKESVKHSHEIIRLFLELRSKEARFMRKPKAGLEYFPELEAAVVVYRNPERNQGAFVTGGELGSIITVVAQIDVARMIGPVFNIEVWIQFGCSLRTLRRVGRAAKMAKTLPELSRLLGLDNVYEMRPYLQAMNCQPYVAGGCFVDRKEKNEEQDIADARAFHFKMKDLVGYVYSSNLRRRFVTTRPADVVVEGDTVYYERKVIGDEDWLDWPDDPFLGPEYLELYVGGRGYDPKGVLID